MDSLVDAVASPDAPYPGLRSFSADEALYFFGRELHTEDLLRRLVKGRFVAVVGGSGCGKSSLVRAGLVPALYRGYLSETTSNWRSLIMRPGASPLGALADCLAGDEAFGPRTHIAETVGRTSSGLTAVVADATLPQDQSVLLVVDQFEEIFRFGERRGAQNRSEAALFVSLLLNAIEQRRLPIYVVLTMRSDFLGLCAEFVGLAEALNRSQYLVPRLTREQRRAAIVEPLKFVGTSAEPRLVEQVLNDVGDDPDQLPVLQHALFRSYREWRKQPEAGPVDLPHYLAVGGISGALGKHGDEILDLMPEGDRAVTEKVFRSLTVSRGGVAVRRPRALGDLYAIVGADDDAAHHRVDAVVRTFASRENSFLTLTSTDLAPTTVVDVTHESLMRKWARLGGWVQDETRSAEWLQDLARDVVRRRRHHSGLWQDPELAVVRGRSDQEGWNAAWAGQYVSSDPPFSELTTFLEESRAEQEAHRRQQALSRERELLQARELARARGARSAAFGLLLAVVLAAGGLFLYLERRQHRTIEALQDQLVDREDRLDASQRAASDLKAQFEAKQYELSTANAAQRDELQKQADNLERLYRDAASKTTGLQTDVDRLRKNDLLTKSDHSDLIGRLERLQQQLNQVVAERDRLKAGVDSGGSAYFERRAADAENRNAALQADLSRLRAASGNTPAPAAELVQDLRVSQKVKLPLRIPFGGRVSIYVGDVNDSDTLAIVFPTAASPTPETASERQIPEEEMRPMLAGRCLADARLSWKDGGNRLLHFTVDNASYALMLTRGNSTGPDQYVVFSLFTEKAARPTQDLCVPPARAKK